MSNHIAIGGALMFVAVIAFILIMTAFQVPATQAFASYVGISVSAPVAWLANTGVAVALVAWLLRR